MGTSLTGTTPQDTYDALIKVGDNGIITGSLKTLSDGFGNDSVLALSTSRIAIGSTIDSGELITAYGAAEAAIVFQNTNSGTGASQGLYLGTLNAENYLWTYEDQPMIFGANNTERMRITGAGVVELAQGQIKFPATQVASADPNTLDDYEEGTWTIGITFGGAAVGVTTLNNTGTYTKIGRKVTVNGRLSLLSKGSSTGSAEISGLPFTIGNTQSNYSAPSFRLANISFTNVPQAFGLINGTSIALEEITILGSDSALTNADFVDTSDIMLSFTYFV